jgi:nucleoside-diphosphate-sugar epimerase
MRILITGGAGYIGSVITNLALQNGFSVRVVDLLWFNPQIPLIHYNNPKYEFVKGDICNTELINSLLKGVDFIIHAAAVVGEPASKKFPDLTSKINEHASINLINEARKKKIKGFIFFSTCSNYGTAHAYANEESELIPLSLYAKTKVNVEKYLMDNEHDMDWVIGRLSTVYGSSPRMRFDLTVNDFTLNAYIKKYLGVFLPESFRPYVHVYDLANIVVTLVRTFQKVKNNVFNIGFEGENYQKIQIAKTVKKYVSDVRIEILKEGGDVRDYRVDFSKLHKFIKIEQAFNIEKAINEIIEMLKFGYVRDYSSPMYYNCITT